MDENDPKQDEIELTDSQRFLKMIIGVGAGWIAKEMAEKGVVAIVKWRRSKTEQPAE